MGPKQAIKDIKKLGLTEIEISRRLREMGYQVSQSTINRIANDETDDPKYSTAKGLFELRDQLIPRRGAERRAEQ